MNKKILFIINPKAGKKKKINITELINKKLSPSIIFKCIFWEYPEQNLEEIINSAINEGYNLIVAVGGDGTVNRIGSILIDKNIPLGIIPLGSGNGLARFLNISLSPNKAIENLLKSNSITTIDTGSINDNIFLCTAGIGFDAHIGNLFAQNKKRGFSSYVKIVIKEFLNYKPQKYLLNIDGKILTITAYLITFANANQWGNNAVIAPEANIQDGLINITVLKPFNLFNVIPLAIKLFNKTINKSSYVQTFVGKEINIIRSSEGTAHFDGEPLILPPEIKIKIKPASLKILY